VPFTGVFVFNILGVFYSVVFYRQQKLLPSCSSNLVNCPCTRHALEISLKTAVGENRLVDCPAMNLFYDIGA